MMFYGVISLNELEQIESGDLVESKEDPFYDENDIHVEKGGVYPEDLVQLDYLDYQVKFDYPDDFVQLDYPVDLEKFDKLVLEVYPELGVAPDPEAVLVLSDELDFSDWSVFSVLKDCSDQLFDSIVFPRQIVLITLFSSSI
ncbi:MAG: hypothetical protein EZS28_010382 [Streblomastix strix]|uniref:Uncharacterized protein n=1 Tax=Streblomastix strix TaxID=222440 RepID=A0A5J4WGD7_9EUKA|nr:MAG: hypothetical protein EZS28_010382 [Streblomastix strix]